MDQGFSLKGNRFFKLLIALYLIFALAGCGAVQNTSAHVPATDEELEQRRGELLVSVDWLKANLNNVVVLDARSAEEYQAGHIPGAVNTPWPAFTDMTGQSGDRNWGTLLPVEQIAQKLGAAGVDEEKLVVVYANPPATVEDGRTVWMMEMAGLDNGRLLDGGWKAWTAAQGEVSQDVPNPQPTGLRLTAMDQSYNATLEWIEENLDGIKVIDSRTEKEYAGSTDLGEKRGGHLPNAIKLTFNKVFNPNGTVRSTQELKALFADAGLNPEDEIVVYCTKGVRAAHLTLMLRMTGYDKARNYDGSIYEWAGDPALPMVMPAAK